MLLEVHAFGGLAHLGGDDELCSGCPCRARRAVRALVGTHASKEEHVSAIA